MIPMNLFTKQKQQHRLREQTYGNQGGGTGRKSRMDMHTLLMFEMDNQRGATIQHREACSMSPGSLDGRGVWGRADTHTCAESLCHAPETIRTLLTGYTPIQNKKLKRRIKKHARSKRGTWDTRGAAIDAHRTCRREGDRNGHKGQMKEHG